jgi:twitching motility protein PilT
LKGIVCQRLVPTADGGRTPSVEIMVNTGRIAERITDPDKTSEIHELIGEGRFYGMVTFDQSLVELVTSGVIDAAAALETSSSPHDFQLMLQQTGVAVSATA